MAQTQLEILIDDRAPSITSEELIQGGSQIFKQQAACPFRAFAELRLRAKPLEQAISGIPATKRGVLIHRILDRVWQQIQTQDNLGKFSENDLSQLVTGTINLVINEMLNQELVYISPRVIAIERQRLKKIILDWLAEEAKRPIFKVVQRELSRQIHVGTLSINIQIDRIDQLSDDSFLIIDYKTAAGKIQSWFGERPKEPQLPIYAVYGMTETESNISGITFAQVSAGQMKFNGLFCEEQPHQANIFSQIIPLNRCRYNEEAQNWQHLLVTWKINLDQLALNFAQGAAQVDPLDATTCNYCDLQPLCRIHQS